MPARCDILRALVLVLLLSSCAPPKPARDSQHQAGPSSERRLSAGDALMKEALAAAERATLQPAQRNGLKSHPLLVWLDYAQLQARLKTASPAQVGAFLRQWDGTPAAGLLRGAWAAELARRQDWTNLAHATALDDADAASRCFALLARLRLGHPDAAWTQAAREIWRSSSAWAASCAEPMQALEKNGHVDDALRWQRIDDAISLRRTSSMRAAAAGLPEAQRSVANAYADFLTAVRDSALQWPKNARSRSVVAAGLSNAANANPGHVEKILPRWQAAFHLDDRQHGRILAAIARASLLAKDPIAPRRLAGVPAEDFDDDLHLLQARDALARTDWPATLVAIRGMPPALRDTARWQWFLGRALDQAGQREAAEAAFHAAARQSEFHGFLAADRLQQGYVVCPLPTPATPLTHAGFRRALALQRLGRLGWAVREWRAAADAAPAAQRIAAVREALAQDWTDRAAFGLTRDNSEELRLHALRFPLRYADRIEAAAARNQIDPAWIAAEIRAESAWNPQARSAADARGLMQLLPETAQRSARRNVLPWNGDDSLYDPATNIAIGSAHLRELMDRADGDVAVVIAGYNAGPNAATRWKRERSTLSTDAWMETIPYRETRDYVPRVLGFSVFYDAMMHGKMRRLTDRMAGKRDGTFADTRCGDPPTTPTTPRRQ